MRRCAALLDPRCVAARRSSTREGTRMDAMAGRNLIVTVLGVIVAIAIAWFLVDVVFHLIWFLAKLIIVAVVAGLVFFALRGLFAQRDEG
jgi:high-affinity Fe2+/Pb2+ permease